LPKIDILERLADNTWHIYEVKSSSSIKTDNKHKPFKKLRVFPKPEWLTEL